MQASTVRAGVANWPRALVALLFAAAMVLWASSGAHAALANVGMPSIHAYDVPVYVYDGATHSVQAHTSEAAGLMHG